MNSYSLTAWEGEGQCPRAWPTDVSNLQSKTDSVSIRHLKNDGWAGAGRRDCVWFNGNFFPPRIVCLRERRHARRAPPTPRSLSILPPPLPLSLPSCIGPRVPVSPSAHEINHRFYSYLYEARNFTWIERKKKKKEKKDEKTTTTNKIRARPITTKGKDELLYRRRTRQISSRVCRRTATPPLSTRKIQFRPYSWTAASRRSERRYRFAVVRRATMKFERHASYKIIIIIYIIRSATTKVYYAQRRRLQKCIKRMFNLILFLFFFNGFN